MSLSSSVVLLNGNKFLNLKILSKSQLLYSPYGSYNLYQERLYSLCISLKKEGLGYRKISKYLNDKGFRTPFSNKPFGNSSVYSIIRKGTIRKEKYKNLKSHKDYGYDFTTSLDMDI